MYGVADLVDDDRVLDTLGVDVEKDIDIARLDVVERPFTYGTITVSRCSI